MPTTDSSLPNDEVSYEGAPFRRDASVIRFVDMIQKRLDIERCNEENGWGRISNDHFRKVYNEDGKETTATVDMRGNLVKLHTRLSDGTEETTEFIYGDFSFLDDQTQRRNIFIDDWWNDNLISKIVHQRAETQSQTIYYFDRKGRCNPSDYINEVMAVHLPSFFNEDIFITY